MYTSSRGRDLRGSTRNPKGIMAEEIQNPANSLLSLANGVWGFLLTGGVDVLVHLGSDTTLDSLDDLGLFGGGSSVDLDVECNKQNEIRRQDTAAGVGGYHSTSTVTTSWQDTQQLREVGIDDLLVGSKVNKAQIQHELNDLETSDPLLPPNSDASGSQEVVPVHDNMDTQIQGNGHPGNGSQTDQLGVAQQRGGTMMVGVQKGQLLLFHDQEHGIDELTELGQVVQVVQRDQLLRPSIRMTDGIEKAMSPDHRSKLLHHQHQQRERQGGQEEVVDLEQAVQHKRLDAELLEYIVAAENHRIVHGNSHEHRRKRGEKRLVRNKLKLRRNKAAAGNLGHSVVEDRPQRHHERRIGREFNERHLHYGRKRMCCWWVESGSVAEESIGSGRDHRYTRGR